MNNFFVLGAEAMQDANSRLGPIMKNLVEQFTQIDEKEAEDKEKLHTKKMI